MKTIVTVDAGGTKTRVALMGEKTGILVQTVTGSGNLALDYDSAEKNIVSAVCSVTETSEQSPSAIVIGAAGISAEGAADRLRAVLREKLRLPVYITSDGNLALYAALADDDGMTVVSGTGSIILAKKDGGVSRCGGWGHLLGEKGSGAAIGYAMLSHICRCHERDGADEEAEKAAFETLGISGFGQLVAYVYSHPKSDIAQLAAAENALALSGNPGAASRLRQAAYELGEDTVGLYRRLGMHGNRIFVSGGCFTKLEYFRNGFVSCIAENQPDAVCSDEIIDPLVGGFAVYQRYVMGREEEYV